MALADHRERKLHNSKITLKQGITRDVISICKNYFIKGNVCSSVILMQHVFVNFPTRNFSEITITRIRKPKKNPAIYIKYMLIQCTFVPCIPFLDTPKLGLYSTRVCPSHRTELSQPVWLIKVVLLSDSSLSK